jgi:hypothetical protein
MNDGRREASRHFRNRRKEYLEDKINGVVTHIENKTIRELYRGVNEFKKGYQPRSK